ncbi:hypothetical protein Hanom_Chr01g00076941 [Helianthus anomalus]
MELISRMKMTRFQTFWIQMRQNKPLDESRKTGQTSGMEMAFTLEIINQVVVQCHYIYKRKMAFSSLRFGQFCDFRPKICFSAFGSKRFEKLPFSSSSLTLSIVLH